MDPAEQEAHISDIKPGSPAAAGGEASLLDIRPYPNGAPKAATLPEVTNEDLKRWGRVALDYLPAVAATGAAIAAPYAAPAAAAAAPFLTGVVGAAAGGAAGEAVRQGTLAAAGSDQAPKSFGEAALRTGESGLEQGAMELGGRLVAKPFEWALGKAANALTKGALRGGYNVGQIDPAVLDSAVQTMKEKGIPFSREGLTDITTALRDLQQDKLRLTGTGGRVDPAAVETRLDQIAASKEWQVNPNADMRQVEQVRQNFRQRTGGQPMLDANGKPIRDQYGNKMYSQGRTIPADEAEALKEGTYANNDYSRAPEHRMATAVSEQSLARGLKEELERQIPELAGLNAQQREFINLQGVLKPAVNKYLNSGGLLNSLTPSKSDLVKGSLLLGAGAGAGHYLGDPVTGTLVSGAVGLTQAVLSDPMVKARLAVAINMARKANPGKYGAPAMIRAADVLATTNANSDTFGKLKPQE